MANARQTEIIDLTFVSDRELGPNRDKSSIKKTKKDKKHKHPHLSDSAHAKPHSEHPTNKSPHNKSGKVTGPSDAKPLKPTGSKASHTKTSSQPSDSRGPGPGRQPQSETSSTTIPDRSKHPGSKTFKKASAADKDISQLDSQMPRGREHYNQQKQSSKGTAANGSGLLHDDSGAKKSKRPHESDPSERREGSPAKKRRLDPGSNTEHESRESLAPDSQAFKNDLQAAKMKPSFNRLGSLGSTKPSQPGLLRSSEKLGDGNRKPTSSANANNPTSSASSNGPKSALTSSFDKAIDSTLDSLDNGKSGSSGVKPSHSEIKKRQAASLRHKNPKYFPADYTRPLASGSIRKPNHPGAPGESVANGKGGPQAESQASFREILEQEKKGASTAAKQLGGKVSGVVHLPAKRTEASEPSQPATKHVCGDGKCRLRVDQDNVYCGPTGRFIRKASEMDRRLIREEAKAKEIDTSGILEAPKELSAAAVPQDESGAGAPLMVDGQGHTTSKAGTLLPQDYSRHDRAPKKQPSTQTTKSPMKPSKARPALDGENQQSLHGNIEPALPEPGDLLNSRSKSTGNPRNAEELLSDKARSPRPLARPQTNQPLLESPIAKALSARPSPTEPQLDSLTAETPKPNEEQELEASARPSSVLSNLKPGIRPSSSKRDARPSSRPPRDSRAERNNAETSNPKSNSSQSGQPRMTVSSADEPRSHAEHSPSVERVLEKHCAELREDNEHWIRTWLCRARNAVAEHHPPSHERPTPAFKNMVPLRLQPAGKSSSSEGVTHLTTNIVRRKNAKSHCEVSKSVWITPKTADIPDCRHFVHIGNNFLAPNETVLRAWPYFFDDFDQDKMTSLADFYWCAIEGRERQLKRLLQAEQYAEYADEMLKEIGCEWSDVLRFLLDPNPRLGAEGDTLLAVASRDTFCQEDFDRSKERWVSVLSALPPADPRRTAKAARLCLQFQRKVKFPIWHLARRSKYVFDLVTANEQEDPVHDEDVTTCRVCLRCGCQRHGELAEFEPAEHHGPKDNPDDIVEKDLVLPTTVNNRTGIGLTSGPLEDGPPGPKRSEKYWKQFTPANERRPFYPCDHPGESCKQANCTCFKANIPCEKSCGCAKDCPRKFQGCGCAKRAGKKGKMVCFEDKSCLCFQLERECDPDLCGECGVCDVLDLVHRHDDDILVGRCRNASIQRGVPKHGLLGESSIHGFGIYACVDIGRNEFVGEYKGEIITHNEGNRRGEIYNLCGLSYLFTLTNSDESQDVDSTYFGNKLRFVNHALKPHSNMYIRIVIVNQVQRIALFADRDIRRGEELLFDYGEKFTFGEDQPNGKKNNRNAAREDAEAPRHKKSIPRNRNSTNQLFDTVETIDKVGNRRISAQRPANMPKPARARTALGRGQKTASPRKPRVNFAQAAESGQNAAGRSRAGGNQALSSDRLQSSDVMDMDEMADEDDDEFDPEDEGSDGSGTGDSDDDDEDDDGVEESSPARRPGRSLRPSI